MVADCRFLGIRSAGKASVAMDKQQNIKHAKMKRFRKMITLLAAAGLLAACETEVNRTPEESDPTDGGERVEMTFDLSAATLKSPRVEVPVVSRGAVNDEQLENLWVLQFDGQSAGNVLQLCEYYSPDRIVGNKVSVALYESKEPVRIYFVANVGADCFASLSDAETLGNFESRVLSMPDEMAVTGSGTLPMVGVYDGSVTFQEQQISLTRMVAKLSFSCSVDILSPGESFTINRVQITDAATGVLYKAPAVPAADTGLYPDASSTDNFTDYALESVDASQGNSVTRTWYVPENLRGVVEGLTAATKGGENAPRHSTCVEVSGDYLRDGVIYDVTYRIYPGQNSSTDFNLIRNHSYTISTTIRGFNRYDLRIVVEKGIPAGSYEDGVWTE